MRKLYLSLVLPLLMLLSQHGAAWHEIGHLRDGPSPVEQGKHQPADKLCESCLAFAHLALAAKPHIPTLALPAFSHALPAAEQVLLIAAEVPAPRSRGPPPFL